MARALFVPLALAVAFAMIASIPGQHDGAIFELVSSRRRHSQRAEEESLFLRYQRRFGAFTSRMMRLRWILAGAYTAGAAVWLALVGGNLGTEIFPPVDSGLLQMRLRAPAGTRVERTERIVRDALQAAEAAAGKGSVESSIAFVGVQPSSYPVNLIFLWTGGPHEAVIRVKFKDNAGVSTAAVQEELRKRIPEAAPGTRVSFEAADLVSQVMSFGAPTSVEIAITGPSLPDSRAYAEKALAAVSELKGVRDAQVGELLEYPAISIHVDRDRAAQLRERGRRGQALAPATSSSTSPGGLWADKSGIVSGAGGSSAIASEFARSAAGDTGEEIGIGVALVGDVATVGLGEALGEYRFNMQHDHDHGQCGRYGHGKCMAEIEAALANCPAAPRGVSVVTRGQIAR